MLQMNDNKGKIFMMDRLSKGMNRDISSFVLLEHNKLDEWHKHPHEKGEGVLTDFNSTNLNETHNWRERTPVAHRKQTSDTLPSKRQ